MDQSLAIVEPRLPSLNGQQVQVAAAVLGTDNTRLAAILRVFQAQLLRTHPLEWVDHHKSREHYLRYLEAKSTREPIPADCVPRPVVTFQFDGRTIPGQKVVEAFETNLQWLDCELESILGELPIPVRNAIRDAVSRLIVRSCHEALLQREHLVRELKRMPENAKYDQITHGNRIVRLGKNCSAETRQHFLSKLPS